MIQHRPSSKIANTACYVISSLILMQIIFLAFIYTCETHLFEKQQSGSMASRYKMLYTSPFHVFLTYRSSTHTLNILWSQDNKSVTTGKYSLFIYEFSCKKWHSCKNNNKIQTRNTIVIWFQACTFWKSCNNNMHDKPLSLN